MKKKLKCSFCLEKPRCDGQRYCRACRNAYQRKWRKKKAKELKTLRRIVANAENHNH
jgi:hypothetical protein